MKREMQGALAVCAAVIGAGFASGREVASFFSRFGRASWVSALAAGAALALAVYGLAALSRASGLSTFCGLCGAFLGRRSGRIAGWLMTALHLCTGAAMCAATGELAALTLPLRHARALGQALSLCLALGLAGGRASLRGLSLSGLLLIPLLAGYCLPLTGGGEAVPLTAHGLMLCLPMGLLCSAFNATLSADVICLSGSGGVHPGRMAVLTGALLTGLLALVNRVLLRAGREVLCSPLPLVLLWSGRGLAGFYASAASLYLACLSTLSACLVSLRARWGERGMLAGAGAVVLLASLGLNRLVGRIYPALGWVCALLLLILLTRFPKRA